MDRGNFDLYGDDFDIEKCKAAAKRGNPEAQESLARCYLFSKYGIEEDDEKGFQLASKSAKKGLPEGLFLVGVCYFYGWGVEEDKEKAVEYYEEAADKGHTEALYRLGDCYYYGRGVEEDEEKAIEYYEEAADRGHAEALYRLGDCYYYGRGVEEDEEKAVEYYEKAADKGHTEALYRLGDCYLFGWGVEEDEEKAIEYYEKAADKGHTEALYELGRYYLHGIYVDKDEEKGIDFLEKAVEKDYIDAIYELGKFYLYGGDYVEKDEEKGIGFLESAIKRDHLPAFKSLAEYYQENNETVKAFKIYKKGKELDDEECKIQLGLCYLKGNGTSKNEKKGIDLLEEAVENDSIEAIDELSDYYYDVKKYNDYFRLLERCLKLGRAKYWIKLGRCYQKGIGTEKDEHKAFDLVDEAVLKFDDGEAYYELGTFYEKGIGIEKNSKKAKLCYEKAKDNGYEPQPKKRLIDYYEIDPEDINSYENAMNYNTDKAKIQSCIVYIENYCEDGCASGSGFIVNPKGLIATCAHVVSNAKEIAIKFTDENKNKKVYKGTVIKINEETDTAIIKIESKRTFPFIDLDDRENAELTEEVVIFGYPLGSRLNDDVYNLNISFAKGHISSNQNLHDKKLITTLNIDAKCGSSGSPIISCKTGKVVGTLRGAILGKEEWEEVNYMMPVCYLHDLLEEVRLQEKTESSIETLKDWTEITSNLRAITEYIKHVIDEIEEKYIG